MAHFTNFAKWLCRKETCATVALSLIRPYRRSDLAIPSGAALV
jgi:hypothetical protein